MKRLWALASLVLSTMLIVSYLWWGKFHYYHESWEWITYLGSIFLLLSNHWIQRDSRARLGLRLDNWRPALKWYGGITLGLASLSVAAGILYGEARPVSAPDLTSYFLWSGIQQYFLQNFLRIRAEDVLRPEPERGGYLPPSLLAAAIFGGLHWPNHLLTLLTLLAALLWCLTFTRVPSFPAVWVSHAVLGILLLCFFKSGPLQEFRIGQEGHRFEYYGGGVLVAGGADASGSPFIATVPGWDLGKQAHVRIYRPDGSLLREWIAFPDLDFSARLSVGDVLPGGGAEIVLAPGPGSANPPLVRVFSTEGDLLSEFRVPQIESGYGAWVSAACGKIYVCPGPAPEADPQVFEFSARGQKLREWRFENAGFINGLKATAVCEACDAPESCPSEKLLIWGTEISVNPSTLSLFDLATGEEQRQATLPTTFGLNASLVDLGGERAVAVSPGPLKGYPAWVQFYSFREPFELIKEIAPYTDDEMYGANLAALDIDSDGVDELVMGEGVGPGRPSTVRVVRLDGKILQQWRAYPEGD